MSIVGNEVNFKIHDKEREEISGAQRYSTETTVASACYFET